MKTKKENSAGATKTLVTPKAMVNPFVKLIKDKERIAKAVENDEPLSSLKDIRFVRPI